MSSEKNSEVKKQIKKKKLNAKLNNDVCLVLLIEKI